MTGIIHSGVVYFDNAGKEWVHIASRPTTTGSIEEVFAQVIEGNWPHCLRTYKATKSETIKKKFPGWFR